MKLRCYIICIFILALTKVWAVECGADRISEFKDDLLGKKVALVVNHTSVISKTEVHLLDTLLSLEINVAKIFTPEHGFRGTADAGEHVLDNKDAKSGLPIISLYGKNRKPKAEDLADVDVLVFDIQDVGARFYTYISTLFYVMQSAAEMGKEVIVLDRPNPNDYVDGPILEDDFRSFVGILPLPLLHGLTMGELAQMINQEKWASEKAINLKIVELKGWKHGQKYSLTIKPSPNLPNDHAIALYPSLCIFEATKFSVGRGTLTPFEVVGYPDKIYGDFSFTPKSLEGFDKNPKHKDKPCYGLDLSKEQAPKGFTLKYLIGFIKKSPEGIKIITSPEFFDKLMGNSQIRKLLEEGKTEEQIRKTWQKDLDEYKALREKYLIY
ncbi:MAG: DUF1343 domain-containing protein [Rikenellaceae bacterium]